MPRPDGSISFYFFDVDDNLLFLPTKLYLWNAESQTEQAVSSREFANIQNDLGRRGKWQPWTMRAETFRDFRDQPGIAASAQVFVNDIRKAVTGSAPWQGPSGRCWCTRRTVNGRSWSSRRAGTAHRRSRPAQELVD